MMICALAPRAKVAARPNRSRGSNSRVSRSAFSAAADLVVKPATPPRSTSERVGNFSVAAGVVAPEAAKNLGRQSLVEVRGLSGEALVKAHFQHSDRVLSVKDRVLEARSIPLWQQMLSFQGEMLNDQSTLCELNLLEGAVFDFVLKSGPTEEDMEALADVTREVLMAGTKAMDTLTKNAITEVRAMKIPPQTCEKVCLAALHMLAGLVTEIPIKKDGSPKNADWSACILMMRNPADFVKQVLALPSCIDQGRVMDERVLRCRQLIDAVEGDSDEEKIYHVARCSLACRALITFLLGVVKYYDSVTEFRERFGGATITELKSHQ